MSTLHDTATDYLTLRRQLGFKLKGAQTQLAALVDYVQGQGEPHLTAALALAWAQQPQGTGREWLHQRMALARGFAQYLKTIDPLTEIPSPDLLPGTYHRVNPYLYSANEVEALMAAARDLRPALRAATYETLIGLLTVTGLRIQEAINLDQNDISADRSSLTVRHSKRDSSRELPLHETTMEALKRYTQLRENRFPIPRSPPACSFPSVARGYATPP